MSLSRYAVNNVRTYNAIESEVQGKEDATHCDFNDALMFREPERVGNAT